MKMHEHEFLELLESKAAEQRRLVKSGILPQSLTFLGEWLGVHPWRVVVPVSILIYLSLRIIGGVGFREMILGVFGGFR